MQQEEKKIQVHDKREDLSSSFHALQLSENSFCMFKNGILNSRLTLGTEFETRKTKSVLNPIVKDAS